MQNRQRQTRIDRRPAARLCEGILAELGAAPCAVSVAFIGKQAMQDLNAKYRGRYYATDVLSFCYHGESEEGLALLGEVVVCPEVALANAKRWGTSGEQEMRKLLAHGLLHLLGHDHEADTGEMMRLQRRLMRRRVFASAAPLLRI